MEALETTLAAVKTHGWRLVLLEPGTKRPAKGGKWRTTNDLNEIRSWVVDRGGNIGIDAKASGIVIIDIDKPEMLADMAHQVGPLPAPTATSPSGGLHFYLTTDRELPPYIEWNGERIGEILRGTRQQAVMPPSPYPGNPKRGVPAGGFYTWLADPVSEIYELPKWWAEYLCEEQLPAWMERSETPEGFQNIPEQEWTGATPEELMNKAMQQPGARRRAFGVKFQCPACAEEGHDRHRDNAVVRNDGRWGCAHSGKAHSRAIGVALGALTLEIPLDEEQVFTEWERTHRLDPDDIDDVEDLDV